MLLLYRGKDLKGANIFAGSILRETSQLWELTEYMYVEIRNLERLLSKRGCVAEWSARRTRNPAVTGSSSDQSKKRIIQWNAEVNFLQKVELKKVLCAILAEGDRLKIDL